MADVHRLVMEHGRLRARELAQVDQRPLVDLAAKVLEEESQALGITYSGFCLTSLPHKRLADNQHWERKGARITLLVEPGRLKVRGETRLFGVPYGSRARLILLYLQTCAVLENSSQVELGRSMNAWLERMGIPVGGKTYNDVREQASRISACNLTFFWEDEGREAYKKDPLVIGGIRMRPDTEQGRLWEDTVQLSDTFFRALRSHPVPLWEPAIRHLQNRSMALDVYVWLAYRLHVLAKATPVSWPSLFQQFGGGFKDVKHFKPRFRAAVAYATTVYPDAHIEFTPRGLTLHPSRPPVAAQRLLA
jgi:Plasmid encoded RepA protein